MKNYWSKLPTTYRGAIVLSIPAFCLLITLGAWVCSSERERALESQINHTQKVISQSNELLIALLNAETGVRGYNIGREVSLLEPYEMARKALPNAMENLEQLIPSKSPQQQRFKEIERLSWQRMAIAKQRIKLIKLTQLKDQSKDQLSQLNNSLRDGKETMDSLRVAIASLQKNEQNFLEIRQQNLSNARKISSSIQWSTTVISAIAYAVAMCLYKNLEQNLSESQTIIAAITSNVVDGVVTLTKQGKIETFNQAAAKMFGYETDEVIDKNLTTLITGCLQYDQDEQGSNFENACPIELNRPWQTQGNSKTGKAFPIEISLSNMQLNDRLIVIIRDITERQEADEKLTARAVELARLSRVLKQTNQDLGIKNQELEQFAFVVSHDLKAPLRAIANLSEWIEEDLKGQLPAENQRQMELLRGRVHRLEALINGLLEYSRVSRTKVVTEKVDVGTLLAEIIDSLDPPPTFKIEIQPGMPTIKTKRIFLSQVFSNLIGNAIKHHHRRDAHIKISYQDQGELYEFTVADDGPGIVVKDQEKVFALFQTSQASVNPECTGIGLAIVKKIVETEGGNINMESIIKEGAVFRFTWLKEITKN